MSKDKIPQTAKKLCEFFRKETSSDCTIVYQDGGWYIRMKGVPMSDARFIGFENEKFEELRDRMMRVDAGCVPDDEEDSPGSFQYGICD